MDEKELALCLEALIDDPNLANLPDNLTSHYLFNDILGFQEVDKEN